MEHRPINLNRLKTLALALLATVWLAGCGDDDENNTTPALNAVELAQAELQLSTLADAVAQAGLVDALSDDSTPITIFAPNNSAFADYLAANPDFGSLSDIPDEALADVLRYHVVPGTKLAADLTAGSLSTLLDGQTIAVTDNDGVVLNGTTRVIQADIRASNGVIHIIDAVLRTAAEEPGTIAEIASATDDLSILVDALTRIPALLDAASDAEADLTVFAPTNEAFAAFLEGDERFTELASIPDDVLTSVLQYHILGAGKLAADLGATEATLEGADINIDKTDGVVINGSANVILDLANIEAANGVVHVIDEVLIPPFIAAALGTAVQPLLFDAEERFTTLLTAVESVPDVLNFLIRDDVDGTLFAPTNAAFEALYGVLGVDGVNDIPIETLQAVLIYHVISGEPVFSTDLDLLENGQAQTVNGGTITVNLEALTITDGNAASQDAAIVIANVLATNGVIHAIDQVLLPE